MAFELPPLPYDYSALEPAIDTQTMQLHHDKHHAAYVTNLNNALQGLTQFDGMTVEDVLRRIAEVPENVRMAVRNNGGGHVESQHVLADHEAQRRRRANWRASGRHHFDVWLV